MDMSSAWRCKKTQIICFVLLLLSGFESSLFAEVLRQAEETPWLSADLELVEKCPALRKRRGVAEVPSRCDRTGPFGV